LYYKSFLKLFFGVINAFVLFFSRFGMLRQDNSGSPGTPPGHYQNYYLTKTGKVDQTVKA
jgi:hypothetical protein